MSADNKRAKPRGKFVPPGYGSRLSAFMDVVRFGPTALPGATFLVLLFHVERSLPYGKKSDAASLSQMTDGIRRSDRSWVRAGSGLTKSTAAAANLLLESKGLLKRKTKESNRGGHQPTEYTVNWEKLGAFFASVCRSSDTPLVRSQYKPLSDMRTTPLSAERTHRVRQSSSQSKDSQSLGVSAQGSTAGATSKKTRKAKTNSLKFDDEKPKTAREGEIYAHPEDELKAVYRQKTGDELSLDVERRIWELVEIREVPRKQFMDELRKHVPNVWKNPAGFLTNFARKIGSVSTPELVAPLEPEPPKKENGRCSGCNGIGYAHWDEDLAARAYCDCALGRELKRVDARPSAAAVATEAVA